MTSQDLLGPQLPLEKPGRNQEIHGQPGNSEELQGLHSASPPVAALSPQVGP